MNFDFFKYFDSEECYIYWGFGMELKEDKIWIKI